MPELYLWIGSYAQRTRDQNVQSSERADTFNWQSKFGFFTRSTTTVDQHAFNTSIANILMQKAFLKYIADNNCVLSHRLWLPLSHPISH